MKEVKSSPGGGWWKPEEFWILTQASHLTEMMDCRPYCAGLLSWPTSCLRLLIQPGGSSRGLRTKEGTFHSLMKKACFLKGTNNQSIKMQISFSLGLWTDKRTFGVRQLFYKSTKSFQDKGKGLLLVVYDRGVPSGRVITNSIEAANHIFLIQKKQLIQGEICLFINAFTHHQDQRSCVSKYQLFLLRLICSGLTFCSNTALSRRPYQLASPSLVHLLGHHPDHFQCHLSLIRRYLVWRWEHMVSSCCKEAGNDNTCMLSCLAGIGASYPNRSVIYHVPSLKNPEESKVLIGFVESSCIRGFWRHIKCLPPLLAELVQTGPFQFPNPCLLAC